MQIVQSKSNIVEKVLRDKEGRLIRARFFVYENAGRIKARLLDFVYLEEKVIKAGIQALCGFIKKTFSPRKDLGGKLVVPLYFASEILYSSGTKARAPTFG